MIARRFSALLTVTVLTEAIMYKRLLMQRDAAGIATERPMMKRVAEIRCIRQRSRMVWFNGQLTDIAPDGCPVDRITVPHDGVDKTVETS